VLEPVVAPDLAQAEARVRVFGRERAHALEAMARQAEEAARHVRAGQRDLVLGALRIELSRFLEVADREPAPVDRELRDLRGGGGDEPLGATGARCLGFGGGAARRERRRGEDEQQKECRRDSLQQDSSKAPARDDASIDGTLMTAESS